MSKDHLPPKYNWEKKNAKKNESKYCMSMYSEKYKLILIFNWPLNWHNSTYIHLT
jgi:hypothetical protein